MEAVGDFTLEDKIFLGIPGDSLLFEGAKLMRLWQKNYSIPTHLPLISHTGDSSNVASGGTSSHSTFKPEAEARSQGVMTLVTPPTAPQTPGMARSHTGTALPRGKLSSRRKRRTSTRTKPHARTLTAPPPRGPMVVMVGSTALARTVPCLP